MTHAAPFTHEAEENLIYTENGLSPYWATGKMLIQQFDGYAELETELLGGEYSVDLAYHKSGFLVVVAEGFSAWKDCGGDPGLFLNAIIKATQNGERFSDYMSHQLLKADGNPMRRTRR